MQVGVPVAGVDQADVYQENEDLKEELARLAAKVRRVSLWEIDSDGQVEFYKIVGMMSANHHIKQSKSSPFALAAPVPQPVQPVQSGSPPPVPQRTASYHCYSLPRQALPGPENRQDSK